MEQYSRLPISVLESLPEADGEEIHRIYQEEWKDFGRKVLVLDDDPTGILSLIHIYQKKQSSLLLSDGSWQHRTGQPRKSTPFSGANHTTGLLPHDVPHL